MAIVNRRTFYARVGMAGALLEHLHEFGKLAALSGQPMNDRLLTDYQSGRSDRVVWEWEVDSLWALENAFAGIMESEAARDALSQWERKMNDMIHYAEVENWQVQ